VSTSMRAGLKRLAVARVRTADRSLLIQPE
jgi:hypothetical protein